MSKIFIKQLLQLCLIDPARHSGINFLIRINDNGLRHNFHPVERGNCAILIHTTGKGMARSPANLATSSWEAPELR